MTTRRRNSNMRMEYNQEDDTTRNHNNNNNNGIARRQRQYLPNAYQTSTVPSWQSTPRRFQLWVKQKYPSTSSYDTTTVPSVTVNHQHRPRPVVSTTTITSTTTNHTGQHPTGRLVADGVIDDQAILEEEEQPTIWTVDDALSSLSSYRYCFPVQQQQQECQDGEKELYGNHYDEDDDHDDHVQRQIELEKTQSLLEKLNWEGKYRKHTHIDGKNDDAFHNHNYSDNDDKNDDDNPELLLQCGSSLGQQEYQFAAFDDASIGIGQPQQHRQDSIPVDDDLDIEKFQDFQQAYQSNVENEEENDVVGGGVEPSEITSFRMRGEDDHPVQEPTSIVGTTESMSNTPTHEMQLQQQQQCMDIVHQVDSVSSQVMDRTPLVPNPSELGHTSCPSESQMDRSPLQQEKPTVHWSPEEEIQTGTIEKESSLAVSQIPVHQQIMDRTPPLDVENPTPAIAVHSESTVGSIVGDPPHTRQYNVDSTGMGSIASVSHSLDTADDLPPPSQPEEVNELTSEGFDQHRPVAATSEAEKAPIAVSDSPKGSSPISEKYSTPGKMLNPEPNTPIVNNYSQVKPRRIYETDSKSTTTETTPVKGGTESIRRRPFGRPPLSSNKEQEAVVSSPPHPSETDHDSPPTRTTKNNNLTERIPSEVQLITRYNDDDDDDDDQYRPDDGGEVTSPIPRSISTIAMTPFSVDTPNTSRFCSPDYQKYKSHLQSSTTPTELFLQSDRRGSTTKEYTHDLSTPEGRFVRRNFLLRQSSLGVRDDNDPYDSDDDTSSIGTASLGSLRSLLPEGFNKRTPKGIPGQSAPSEAAMDEALYETLNDLEWDWIPYWKMESLLQTHCDESFVPLWLEQITQQLSEMDVTYTRLTKKVHRYIQPRQGELESANQAILALSKNLQLCEMYLKRGQESVLLARYGSTAFPPGERDVDICGGVNCASQLLRLWDTKESYSDMSALLASVTNIFQRESQLLEKIEEFDIREAASLEKCRTLLDELVDFESLLATPVWSSLESLNDVRTRVSQFRGTEFPGRLHSWLEGMTIRCCHGSTIHFDGITGNEYRRLIEMILMVELCDDDPSGISVVAKSVCTTIHASLLLEAQKSFGMALLSPTDTENEHSDYEKELLALSTNSYLDPSRMTIWTHNLVTVRFDFELQVNHLPAIVHKLCWQLTNILRTYHVLLAWHKHTIDAWEGSATLHLLFTEILNDLSAHRASIWNACVKVLEECMEEYLKVASKKQLFQWGEDGICDDSVWIADLVGLEDVVGLIQQFLSSSRPFLVGIPNQQINEGTILNDKLDGIMKKHAHSVKVAAMTNTGTALYREKWEITSVPSTNNRAIATIESLEEYICQELQATQDYEIELRFKGNHFYAKDSDDSLLVADHNPFEVIESFLSSGHRVVLKSDANRFDRKLIKMLQSYLEGSFPLPAWQLPMPQCVAKAVLPWFGRILTMMQSHRSLAFEASEILTGISNLYLTTAFRIATGSANNERLVLGIDTPPPFANHDEMLSSRVVASSSVFGFGRWQAPQGQTSSDRPPAPLTMTTEAEICSPLQSEFEDIKQVRTLLLRAQDELKGIAKLHLVDQWVVDPTPSTSRSLAELACDSARVLEKRQLAIWGYGFMALTMEIALEILVSQDSTKQSDFEKFSAYVGEVSMAVPKLIEVGSRLSCLRAIRGRVIVRQVLLVGNGWEEAKLHEHPNEYVESVSKYMALLWCSLCSAKKIPPGAIEIIWKHAVEGVFSCFLDGFSRVPYCSTEGRSLMSMDVACLAGEFRGQGIQTRLEGHTGAPVPPTVMTERGMAYVDTYIKIFYLPTVDAMEWIKDNFTRYQQNHMVTLIIGSAGLSAETPRDSVPKFVRTVKRLYSPSNANDKAVTAKILAI